MFNRETIVKSGEHLTGVVNFALWSPSRRLPERLSVSVRGKNTMCNLSYLGMHILKLRDGKGKLLCDL